MRTYESANELPIKAIQTNSTVRKPHRCVNPIVIHLFDIVSILSQ